MAAAAIATQSGPVAPEAADSAKRSSAAARAAAVAPQQLRPRGAARRGHIARQRRVERSTRLELSTTDVQKATDGVVRATQAAGGFVQSSQVATGDGRSTASFVLRVPTSRLDDAMARLSQLGHVKSLQQSADDITGAYDGASGRLTEARAERRGLLRALADASTAQQITSLRARLADNRRDLQRYQRDFNAVRNRANLATVGVEVTGAPRKHAAAPSHGSWTPGRRRARRRARPRGERGRRPHRPRGPRPAHAGRRSGRVRRRHAAPPSPRGGAVGLTPRPYKSCNLATWSGAAR